MAVRRLREPWSDEKLKEIYATPHDHTQWEDHHLRVNATIELTDWLMRDKIRYSVADLSCGNAYIARNLMDADVLHLGDFALGYEYHGPIEKTISEITSVDLFVLSETLEHVNDPFDVLEAIRKKSSRLVMSTPINEQAEIGNEQHYWGWDQNDIHHLLIATGWDPVVRKDLIFYEHHFTYDFQIWGCR